MAAVDENAAILSAHLRDSRARLALAQPLIGLTSFCA